MDDGGDALIVTFVMFVCAIALIPAFIAQSKGRNLLVWWIYGVAFFLIALVHALCLKSPDAETRTRAGDVAAYADALTKLAELKEKGLITEAEFEAKKSQLR